MIHYLIGDRWTPEALLFADDLLTLAGSRPEIEDFGLAILLLTSWGVPLKWGKFRGAQGVAWISYEINFRTGTVGISEKRAKWLISWMEKCLTSLRINLFDLNAVLGRLSFAMGPLDFLWPFVAPLYAWYASMGRRVW